MNKEEIKKAIKIVFYEDCKKCYFPRRKCANCVRDNRKKINIYIKQLKQKETILDKVTDKLKEVEDFLEFCRDRDMDSGYGEDEEDRAVRVYIESILNIVEGEKNDKR